MNRWLQQWSVAAKLRLMALLAVGALLVMSVWQGWETYEATMNERQVKLKDAVESAVSIVQWAHAQELSGQLNRDAAQALAKSALAAVRYGNGHEYFWINDMHPTVVMHPIKPELNGKDASSTLDPNGKALFVEFAKTVRANKAGFVDYQWPKPGSSDPVDKLSYVQGFEPWGWVVGTGLYIDDVQAAFTSYVTRLGGVLLLFIGLTTFFTQSITRSIVGGVRKAVQMARAIADGDISQRTRVRGHDEIAGLITAMNDMSDNLQRMVTVVQETAQSMETAASEIAAGNHDLSGRTEGTASHLHQTAMSMGQINESAQENATSAAEATQLSKEAALAATQGNEVVLQVVDTMNQISESSRRISDITGVIDSIAFQTNILALNAAVEAARAGEQGRGFAVVAAEVRALAQRSANAAKEIKTLIGDSVEKVNSGNALVSSAGVTIGEVVQEVKRVQALVEGMQQVNQQLTEGVHEINTAMTELEQNTSQNSALVEESAAATQSLRDQALRLTEVVGMFKLGTHRG
jgi:methyl-accepting chemotaxis protein